MTTPSVPTTAAPLHTPRLNVPGLSIDDLWLAPNAGVVATLSGPDSTGASTLLFLDSRSGAQRGALTVGAEEIAVISAGWSYGASHDWAAGSISVWRPDSGTPVGRLNPHGDGGVHALAIADRGDVAASLGEDGRVALWQPADGAILSVFEPRTDVDLQECGLAFSPDARLLAVRADTDTIELWRTAPLELIDNLPEFGDPLFSPDGRWVAADGQGGISLYDLRAGGPPAKLPGAGPVGFNADGTLLVAGGGTGQTTVWRTSPPEPHGYLPGDAWALSPDGGTLAIVGPEPTLVLVDIARGNRMAQLGGIRGDLQALAVGPGGAVVAAACSDATLRVWA